MVVTRKTTSTSGGGGGGSGEIIMTKSSSSTTTGGGSSGGGGGVELSMSSTRTVSGGGEVEISKSSTSKTATKMLDAAQVATMEVASHRQEAENDMNTIEETPRSRRPSRVKSVGLPPPGPSRPPVMDLTEVHGPLYPIERKHEYPKDPPARVESKSKDEPIPCHGNRRETFVYRGPQSWRKNQYIDGTSF